VLEWDAQSYDALPLPHKRWGHAAIERLRLTGSETVADLGCGTGRDAQQLLAAVPHGHVVALDRVEVVHADLRKLLPLNKPVDAVLSVATLHWLPDHARLFTDIASMLRPGGQFVAEAGGHGNITTVREALADLGADDGAGTWNFTGADEATAHLEAAGFNEIQVDLVPDPARLKAGEQLEAFLATVVLGAHLRDLPPRQHRPFVHAVAQRLPEPVVDYVRIQIRAVKP
jgi:trans-aconitate 2-methyltransferase